MDHAIRHVRSLLATLAVALFGLTAPVFAAEEIRSFDSNVALATNGTVDVTETITVNSEGDQIRHGIFRDIPTQLINDDKTRLRSDLKVLGVQRDDADENYSLESLGGGFTRIRIGSADTFVDPGLHTYVIHYTMSRMGRFFDDHDELFWNATGNYWDFPILSATATITLPQGGVVQDAVGYTGIVGSHEQAVTVGATGGQSVTFRATRTLKPGEGMSVAVKCP